MMVTRMKTDQLAAFDQFSGAQDHIAKQKANIAYLHRYYKRLVRDYPNHWIIIRDGGENVRTESDPDRFVEILEETRTTDGVMYYLADPEEVMLL